MSLRFRTEVLILTSSRTLKIGIQLAGQNTMETDEITPTRNLVLIKLFASTLLVAAAAAAAWIFYPSYSPLLHPGEVVDQGKRLLVTIASSGSDRDYSLHVRSSAQTDGSYEMVFYFTAEGITYGEGGNTTPIDYRITFAGTSTDTGISCGTSLAPIGEHPYDQLAVGTQTALEADAAGGAGSAINFNGDSTGLGLESLEANTYPETQGQLYLLTDGAAYTSRSAGDSTTVWAESCTIPAALVWRYPESNSLVTSGRRTLLPPQVNWTSVERETDYQRTLIGDIVVPRTPGLKLAEGYPSPAASDTAWSYNSQISWIRKIGEAGNIAYSDQPVFIFSRRNFEDERGLFLLGSGVVLGLIATLIVQILSRSTDLIWLQARLRKSRSETRRSTTD
jgi:hypothetical protein